MIGIWGDYAQTYLLVFGILTTLFFALPIFFTPLAWARMMQWQIPQETDLAVYFGRCLGAFIIIVELLIFRAAINGVAIVTTFEIMLAIFAFMLVVHIYGAIKKIQPITETLENILWLILLLLSLAFYPSI